VAEKIIKNKQSFLSSSWLQFGFIFLILLIGAFAIDSSFRSNQIHTAEQLRSIAKLKSDQIQAWRNELFLDAEHLRKSVAMNEMFLKWQKDNDLQARAVIQNWMNNSLREIWNYESVFISNADGEVLLGVGNHLASKKKHTKDLELALSTGKIQFTSFYRDNFEGNNHLNSSIIIPLISMPDRALIIVLNSNNFLFPFLKKWSSDRKTAETLLFKRDGNSVLYLNDLRYKKNAALNFRVPFKLTDVLAVQLLNGNANTAELIIGEDYRGEECIGVAEKIKQTSWYLIAKIDKSEMYAGMQSKLFWLLLSLLLAVITVITGGLLLKRTNVLKELAETERKKSEDSLASIFDVLPDLFFRFDNDGTILDYRATNIEALILPPEKFLNKNIRDVLPRDVAEKTIKAFKTTRVTDDIVEFECQLTLLDVTHCYEARVVTLNDFQLIAVIRDITQQKRISEELFRSEQRYREVITATGGWAWEVDCNGLYTFASEASESLLGYHADEIVGKKYFYDLFEPVVKDELKNAAFEVFEKKQSFLKFINPNIHKNGDTIILETSGVPIFNEEGEFLGYRGVDQDITEKYELDRRIKESENKLRDLIYNLEVAIVVHKPDTSIAISNPKASELLGLSAGKIQGKKEVNHDWCFVNESNKPVDHDDYPVNRIIKSHEPLNNVLIGIKRSDIDSVVWVLVNGFPSLDKDGNVKEVIISFVDITDNINYQSALRKSEKYNRMLFEESSIGLALCEMDGSLIDVNSAYANITGYSIDEVKKLNFWKISPEKYNEDDKSQLEELNKIGRYGPYVKENIRKDGSLVSIRLQGLLLEQDNRKLIWSSVEDVTKSKILEDKLKNKNRLYATLSQLNQTIIRKQSHQQLFKDVCDIAVSYGKFRMAWIGIIDEINQRINPVAFSGEGADYLEKINISLVNDLTLKGPTGRAIFEGKGVVFNNLLTNPDFVPWRETAIKKGYSSSGAFPLRHKEKIIGTFNVYAVEANFFDIEEVELLEETVVDVSYAIEKIESEKEYLYSQKLLQQANEVIENSPMVVFRWKAVDGWPVELVSNNVSQFGYTVDDLTSGNVSFESIIHPDDRERISQEVKKNSSIGVDTFQQEYRIVTTEGDIRWIEDHTTVERDSSGNITHYRGVINDTTERRKVAGALEKYATNLALSQKLAHMGSWEFDIVNDQLSWSDEMYRILEINQREFEPTYSAFLDIVHSDDQLRVKNTYQKMLTTKKPYESEYRLLLKQNKIKYVVERCDISVDENGTTLSSRGTLLDVTEQKQAEIQLDKSLKEWANAMDFFDDAIYLIGLDDRVIRINKAFTQMTGLTSEQVIGRDIVSVLHPKGEVKPCPICKARLAKEDADITMEATHVYNPTGKPIEVSVRIIRDNKRLPLSTLVNMHDLSRQRQSREELNKLAQAVEQSPESIVISDLNGDIEYVNETFVRNTGYSRDEVIGQNPRILHSGNTPAETYEGMWEKLIQGKSWKGEFCNRRKDGATYTEFAHISPIMSPEGEISHFVAVKEDITEKKIIAKELDEHRHHLEGLVAQRTNELVEARHKAEIASQVKSEFLANMSHEIRTPMNAIIGLTHLMQRDKPEPAQLEKLIKIDNAAGHLLSIINDILDLSKIEAEKITLEESDFNLISIFEHILSLSQEQALTKGLKISVNVNIEQKWFKGDSTRLRQALLNYVANAIKFTEKGSITLSARVLQAFDEDVLIKFEVQDTGIGIESGHLNDLFNAFEQADASTTRMFGGTGLGLAITRRLAQLMGGEAGAESEPGRGSTFWFTARLKRGHIIGLIGHVEETIDAENEIREYYQSARILLVEDNEINAEVASELLSDAGLVVDIATDGQQAVEKVKAHDYDVVLMDVQMPVMDGLEATRIIHSMKDKMSLPVLAMTANVFADDEEACRQATMNDFVAKPVNPENLFSTLIKWLPDKDRGYKMNVVDNDYSGNVNKSITKEEGIIWKQLEAIEGLDSNTVLNNLHSNVAGYLRLLKQFNSNYSDDMEKLKKLFDNKEYKDAKELIHSIKGASATLGLLQLQMLFSDLENLLVLSASKKRNEEVNFLMNEISLEQNNINDTLERISWPKNEIIHKVDGQEIKNIINKIKDLLMNDDAAVNKYFLKSEAILSEFFGGVVRNLEENLSKFNYSSALDVIEMIEMRIERDEVSHKYPDPIDISALMGMFGNNKSKHLSLLRKFIPQAEFIIEGIYTSCEHESAEKVKDLAHKLKSSSRTVGANELADLCLIIEKSAMQGDWILINSCSEKLYKVMDMVKCYIDKM
jgi:two-component system, sensor histidine kinase and response regulator